MRGEGGAVAGGGAGCGACDVGAGGGGRATPPSALLECLRNGAQSLGFPSRFPRNLQRGTLASRFGPFVLDRERRQLLENGAEVHLSPKAYTFLTTLIDAYPSAVSKADLHERLWPGTFVLEANLTVLAAEVRKALRDSGRHGQFIRTVHSFGYAFEGEVTEEAPAGPSRENVPGRRSLASAAVRCWLVYQGRETMLGDGEHVIGRDADADVRVDIATVSRRHAKIVVRGSEATISDMGSKNGTWVGAVRITGPVVLHHGDEIRISAARLVYRTVVHTMDTQTEIPT